jgi:hypothetical protein
MGRARTCAGSVAAALVLAQPAMALAPGVFVNPGSPAGKEYSFPLSVLRGNAAGQASPAGASQPQFGLGITPAGPSGSGTATSRTRGNSAGARPHHGVRSGHHRVTGRTAHPNPGRRDAETALASLARPSSDVPQIALIAAVLLVVAVASGAGIAAARRRS